MTSIFRGHAPLTPVLSPRGDAIVTWATSLVNFCNPVFGCAGREVDDVVMIGDGEVLYVSRAGASLPSRSNVQTCGNYRVEETLGKGSFGKVYKGVHQVTLQPVALKFIFKSALGTIRDVERVVGEIQCLESLVHPNVIALREVLTTEKGHVVLAMEYAGGGDLCRMVNEAGRLTESVAGPLFAQILDGVAYCHRCELPSTGTEGWSGMRPDRGAGFISFDVLKQCGLGSVSG